MYKRYRIGFCTSMIMRERCPIIKCDFFEHIEKHKVYRVVRREKKRDQLIRRLESLEKRIGDLAERL